MELRARKLKELEDKLAREKHMKRLEDFKYKKNLEMVEKKYQRPQTAKNKKSKGLSDQLEKRNTRLYQNQVRLQKEYASRLAEQDQRERSKSEQRHKQATIDKARKLLKKSEHDSRLQRIEQNKSNANKKASMAAKLKEFEAAERQLKIEQQRLDDQQSRTEHA